ncbi:unnamed protein product, partial [Mesorhabditis belari]|uniref:Glutaredoxin domain-containing protein n=1 Tax=Mesorhabditis belari TaxID=2138241 RepID=A0AAF3E808_9BILA
MVFQIFYDIVFSPFGWVIVFGICSAYFFHKKYVAPYLEQLNNEKELEERKKFDKSVDDKVADKVRQARERQQQEYERVAAEQKLKEEEKKKEKLEKMKKEEEKESVYKHAVGSHSVKKVFPAAKEETPKEIIARFIASKPIVVFSKTWCPFCRKVKAALATYRLSVDSFEYVELDERNDLPGEKILDELLQMTGARSVPRVFINGNFIGGCDDTIRLQREGTLDKIIQEALK